MERTSLPPTLVISFVQTNSKIRVNCISFSHVSLYVCMYVDLYDMVFEVTVLGVDGWYTLMKAYEITGVWE